MTFRQNNHEKTAKIATCIIGAIAIATVSAGITYKIAASPDSAGKSDALDIILTRTSIRDYQQGKPIESGKIDTLLRAGMAAPTAVNKQPWSFIVVDRPELLKALADSLPNASMTAKAAAAIVVCGDMTKTLEGEAAEFLDSRHVGSLGKHPIGRPCHGIGRRVDRRLSRQGTHPHHFGNLVASFAYRAALPDTGGLSRQSARTKRQMETGERPL